MLGDSYKIELICKVLNVILHLTMLYHIGSCGFKEVSMDEEPVKCTCPDCGKVFYKGDEGDNEIYCLRCEFESFDDGEDRDYDDGL